VLQPPDSVMVYSPLANQLWVGVGRAGGLRVGLGRLSPQSIVVGEDLYGRRGRTWG